MTDLGHEFLKMVEERFKHPWTPPIVSIVIVLFLSAGVVMAWGIIWSGAIRPFWRHVVIPVAESFNDRHGTLTTSNNSSPPVPSGPVLGAPVLSLPSGKASKPSKEPPRAPTQPSARVPASAPALQPPETASPQTFGPCIGSVCGNIGGSPTVNNNGPPPPKVINFNQDDSISNNDGTFTWRISFAVSSDYTPSNIAIVAFGESIVDMKVSRGAEGGRLVMNTHMEQATPVQAHAIVYYFDSPVGPYTIDVKTKEPSPKPIIKFAFNVRPNEDFYPTLP